MPTRFEKRVDSYRDRIEAVLQSAIPTPDEAPERLHEAMRYAVLNGGKRVRPLLTYAAGECIGVSADRLDAPAASIELIHAFSLIHDDLPAMDDDDLRRGLPTVHRQFDEATAILAGDALLPLAFAIITRDSALGAREKVSLVDLIGAASGSLGMTGGQAMDLAAEGQSLSEAEMVRLHQLKTGALIHAAILAACRAAEEPCEEQCRALDRFARDIGLAFQIRDDLLDVLGHTDTIGKPAGSDAALAKATWPALFGIDASRDRCDALLRSAIDALKPLGGRAEPLRWLAGYIVSRER